MFTGIVEEQGTVSGVEQLGDAVRITILGPKVVSDATHGASISVNGCCLTVTTFDDQLFSADVMRESLQRTNLGGLGPGSPVNLERAIRADARLGGHVVSGHVDGTATVVSVEPSEHWTLVRLQLAPGLARYVVEKGSIALDGASLTVASVDGDLVGVSLIPTTLALTTFGSRRPGDVVNVEVDVLAKYVEKLLGGPR
jgi:riboflavin synthase